MMNPRKIFFILFFLLIVKTICRAEDGTASWYGAELAGRPTASGQPFDPSKLTCASWNYPLGTRLRVTFGQKNDPKYLTKSVVVLVTDRGPNKRLHRVIDLSEAAFAQLADTRRGLIPVKIERVP